MYDQSSHQYFIHHFVCEYKNVHLLYKSIILYRSFTFFKAISNCWWHEGREYLDRDNPHVACV